MNLIEIIATASVIGLAGSLHCVGMCGPIILALPFENSTWLSRITHNGVYYLGKALTYAIMGFAIGLMGSAVFPKHWQQWISIATGVFILLFTWVPKWLPSLSSGKFNSWVIQSMGEWMRKSGIKAQFIVGFLNGLLPCGLVYMALAASVPAGGAFQSALFMFVFGVGTVPLLFILSLSKDTLQFSYRAKLQKAIPYLTTVLAILFILRGLSLGIPLLSPDMNKMENMGKMKHNMHSELIQLKSEGLCH